MGLLPSGDIADCTFYNMVERTYILLGPTRRKHKILCYGRFKDDIVIIFNASDGISHIRDFIEELRRRAEFFKITLDSFSRHGCQMLDVDISISDSHLPRFRLYKKT